MAGEATAPDEVLAAPTFETQEFWSGGYLLALQTDGSVVVGPGHGNPNIFAQTVPTWWGAQYTITATASSLSGTETTAAVQVNWTTEANDLAGVSRFSFPVGAEPQTVTYHVEAPSGAAWASVYITPGDAGDAVRYTQMSAVRIDPIRDFSEYTLFGYPAPAFTAVIVGIVLAIGALFFAIRRGGRRIEAGGAWMSRNAAPRLRVAFPVLAVVACALMLIRLEPAYERNYDSQYHQVLVDVTAKWKDASLDLGGNPLSNFGIQAPINPALVPAFALGQLVDPDIRIPVEGAVEALILLLLSAFVLRAGGAPRAAAFAIGLIAMGFFWIPDLTWGAVAFDVTLGLVWAEAAIATLAALICFVHIGVGSIRSTVAWSVGLLATILWLVLALPYNAPFFVIATALSCAAAVLASQSWREVLTKGIASIAIVTVLIAMRVPSFAIDLFSYTPQQVFSTLELDYAESRFWPPSLSSMLTLIYIAPARTPGIIIFLGLGLVGAAAGFNYGTAMGRRFTGAAVGFFLLSTSIGFINEGLDLVPITFFYVEQTGVAVLTMLAGLGVWVLVNAVIALLTRLVPGRVTPEVREAVSLLLLIVAASWWLAKPQETFDLHWPPRIDSEPVQIQRAETALEPGDQFKGRSVSLLGPRQVAEPWDWPKFYGRVYDYQRAFGNDLMIHARYGGVPVVNEYGHWISPPALALLAAAFYQPLDFIDRAAQAPRAFRANLARMMGVSLVVSDEPIEGETPLFEGRGMDVPIYLSQVAGTNLGQYSPTEIVVAHDATAILDVLQAPDFDGTKVAVAEEPVEGPLVAASSASIALLKGPILRVTASSTGRSLLVLPFDWSHCLVAEGAGLRAMVPVNLAQIGLLIEGDATIDIRYRFGLFAGTHCRREDLERAEALALDEAAGGRLFYQLPR